MNKRTFFLVFPILALILFIYRAWFTGWEIIGGDWPYYWRDSFLEMKLWPSLWAQWQGNGLGGTNPLLGLRLFQSLLIVPFVNWLGFPWVVVYKIGWFGLFILLSFISPIVLWRSAFPLVFSRWPGFLAGLIYSTNTYILMVTGGGQMGVALAYSVAPLVLACFMKLTNIKNIAIAGLILGFQLMIDPRIAYVTMVAVGLYLILNFKFKIIHAIASLMVAVGVNAFWVLPMALTRNNPLEGLGSTYTSIDALKFFSFADFSHALSFLHPNWPENLFGKTFFLQPEFLLLPILAFMSLLLLRQRTESRKQIVFFALLSFAGAFLAKGAQEPFGSVYQWMFTNIPGFVMFRDPTKWYVLIAISYSVLIPFTLKQFAELRIKGKTILIIVFIFFWLFTIHQVVFGQLGGTFVKHSVPQEYGELERFLQEQPNFTRTLWVPRQQRFSYGTLNHMPVEAEPLFGATTAAELKAKLDEPTSMELLEDLGIGYVVIPYDSLGELFLSDRRYDEKKRQEYETVLDGVRWLTKIRSDNLTVYQTPRHRDLFWVSINDAFTYRRIRPDHYAVSFVVVTPTTVYFSQSYHPGWVLIVGNTSIKSQRSPQGLNSFQIQNPGTYEGVVEFEPQKNVTWGIVVSILTVAGVVLAFLASKERRVPV